MMRVRTDLMHHVRGNASVMQRMLVEQCVVLSLRIHLMDREFLTQGGMTEHNSRDYLAWVNALSRLLRQLGIGATGSPEPDTDARRPEQFDAELTAAAQSVVATRDDPDALAIRAKVSRLAYGENV